VLSWLLFFFRPFRTALQAALANPVQDSDLEELLRKRQQLDAQLMDYIAARRTRKLEQQNTEMKLQIAALTARLEELEATTAANVSVAVLNSPALALLIQQHVDAARVIETRVIEKRTVVRNRWHIEKMFSWVGALIGMVVGVVAGLLLNYFLNAEPVIFEAIGKQVTVDGWIDFPWVKILIVGVLALACGLVGGSLFGRRDKN